MNHPMRSRIIWVLAGLAVSGCVSEKTRLLESHPQSPAADLDGKEAPHVTRSQDSRQGGVEQASHIQAPPQNSLAAGRAGASVKVRAWVNGKPIFHTEIIHAIMADVARFQQLPELERARQTAKIYQIALDQYIEREILYQEALAKLNAINPKALKKLQEEAKKEFDKKVRQAKISSKMSDEEFMTQLRRQGTTMEMWERLEERKFFAMVYLSNRVRPLMDKVGRAEIRDYYDKHLDEFRRLDNVKWQDLFIAVGPKHPTLPDARNFAGELAGRLIMGEDVAQLLPLTDGDSRYRNGEGCGQRKGEIQPPELEKYLFEMKDGEIGPLVELSTGVHIIRLVQREYAGQIPFTPEIQKAIRSKLRSEIGERESKRVLHELKNRTVIEIERD
jgi:parvulin-like peptidyl-prolyl isomerase